MRLLTYTISSYIRTAIFVLCCVVSLQCFAQTSIRIAGATQTSNIDFRKDHQTNTTQTTPLSKKYILENTPFIDPNEAVNAEIVGNKLSDNKTFPNNKSWIFVFPNTI